jgi:hypothetical protein
MYREDKYMNKIRNILKMNRYYKNITMPKYALLSYTLILLFVSCGQKDKLSIKDQLVTNEALLTSTLNNDSLIVKRTNSIYAESFIAFNEVYQSSAKNYNSINNQINGFSKIEHRTENIDFDFSSFAAFYKVLEINQIGSKDLDSQKNIIFNYYENELSSRKYRRSYEYGSKIAEIVTNNFKNHKGFNIIDDIDELGYNYPKNFINIPKSELISNGKELIKINNKLSDLQKIICNYWEGNNDKQIKKINIEGHWYSILSHKIKNTNMPISEISKIYAILGLTINEAYKIGEYEEYKTTYISPNNIIKNNLDQNWQPYLKNNINEFNSITSIVSLSASNIISNYLKDNSTFIDSSIYKYTGQVRNYSSLEEAASEASISRAYGGIHYIFTVNEAAGQGKFLASKILNKMK